MTEHGGRGRGWVTLATVLALGGLLALPVLVSYDAPNAAYRDEPDGLSHLIERDGTRIRLLDQPARIVHGDLDDLDPTTDALLVIAPTRAYSDAEVDHVRTFLDRGGRLVVAAAAGSGPSLIAGLDTDIAITGVGVYSLSFDQSPRNPRTSPTGLVAGLPAEMVLDRPSVVAGAGQRVLVTRPYTWLDDNGNGKPDLGEARGQFAIARQTFIGNGTLLAIGDDEFFTGARTSASDEQASRAIVAWLAQDNRTIVLDDAHRGLAGASTSGRVLGGDWPPWTQVLAVAVAAVVATAAALRLKFLALRRKRRDMGLRRRLRPIERAVIAELET